MNKAIRILEIIKRTFVNRNTQIMKRLYTTLVRPVLEYGNVVKMSRYVGDTDKVEKVQKRATRLCDEIRHLTYEERLAKLKLPSMYYRRERGDMIQTYKILNGHDRLDKETILPARKFHKTRGHSKKLVKRHACFGLGKFSFGPRVTDSWNSLPERIVNTETINQFKDRLNKYWKDKHYCTCPYACARNKATKLLIKEERVLQA